MKKIKAENFFYYLLCGVIVWYLYESIIYSKEIIFGVSQTIYRIINVVFPSLFGFMVACEFIVKTGIYKSLSVIFIPISKYLFRLPPQLFSVYLLSCIGGYPVGVKMLNSLVSINSIDKETATRFAPFCYCVSPSFSVGIVGVAIFSSVKIGVIVYISCLIANTLALLIYSHIYKFKSNSDNEKIQINGDILVNSVVSSGKSMLIISAMIIFFSYLINLLDCLKFYDIIKLKNANIFLKSLFDITFISNLSADFKVLPLITAVISFGGICILLQVFCICNKTFSLKRLFLLRIPISLLSALACYLILKSNILAIESVSYVYSQKNDSNFNIFSLICLFFMIIIIFFQKKNCNLEKSVL